VSVGGAGASVGVGPVCAIARPTSAEPNTAVAASTARTQARRVAAFARRREAVTRRRRDLSTDPSPSLSWSRPTARSTRWSETATDARWSGDPPSARTSSSSDLSHGE
jgi:hypothetical protein